MKHHLRLRRVFACYRDYFQFLLTLLTFNEIWFSQLFYTHNEIVSIIVFFFNFSCCSCWYSLTQLNDKVHKIQETNTFYSHPQLAVILILNNANPYNGGSIEIMNYNREIWNILHTKWVLVFTVKTMDMHVFSISAHSLFIG